jgi:glycine/D-amino acid oxidase-like deaminating enzyme
MSGLATSYDAVVIGGGFFGATIASHLAGRRGLTRTLLMEREAGLMTRASFNNQARIHNGYHYPRSLGTAHRSSVNLPRFVRDWADAVERDFTNLYAIARNNSKVTAGQFARFCREIGVGLEPAPESLGGLFDPRLIEAAFLVQEYAFDTRKLVSRAQAELERNGVVVRLSTRVTGVARGEGRLVVGTDGGPVSTRYVFNCTYSGLNQLGGDFGGTRAALKHEITELALVEAPPELAGLAVTVMDGPFFSMTPFPARGLHTLSHVRYTPHLSWADGPGIDPYRRLEDHDRTPRVDRMIRDARRYLPAIQGMKHVDSLFEVKTVLAKNECDDGRPILFERHAELPGCYSVLGGKIDNIYDILEKLDREPISGGARRELAEVGHG